MCIIVAYKKKEKGVLVTQLDQNSCVYILCLITQSKK